MTEHHPDHNLLLEYATGSLDIAQAIAVSVHLHFCPKCQHTVQQMEQLGGAMLEQLAPEALPTDSFDALMARIDSREEPAVEAKANNVKHPRVLKRLLEQEPLKWRKVTSALQSATLHTGQSDYEVSLQKIKAGGRVPEHDHRGLEVTVVLEGSFSDNNGIYQEGDFLVKKPGEVHQPVSACNQDCVCLSIQCAPVKLTGFIGRLMNPFIRLQTA